MAGVDELIHDLGHPEEATRANAIRALRDLGSQEAIPGLLNVAGTDSSNVLRRRALEALGRIGGSEAAEGIASLLKASSNPYLPIMGLRGFPGEVAAIQALKDFLSASAGDPNRVGSQTWGVAGDALKAIAPPEDYAEFEAEILRPAEGRAQERQAKDRKRQEIERQQAEMAAASAVQSKLRWASLFHPRIKRAFMEGRAFLTTAFGHETGDRGWRELVLSGPRGPQYKERCEVCRKMIYAYLPDSTSMPGCAQCLQCKATVCWKCMGEAAASPASSAPKTPLEMAQADVEARQLAAAGFQFGRCPKCQGTAFQSIYRGGLNR